jgi:hypothetical protein
LVLRRSLVSLPLMSWVNRIWSSDLIPIKKWWLQGLEILSILIVLFLFLLNMLVPFLNHVFKVIDFGVYPLDFKEDELFPCHTCSIRLCIQ